VKGGLTPFLLVTQPPSLFQTGNFGSPASRAPNRQVMGRACFVLLQAETRSHNPCPTPDWPGTCPQRNMRFHQRITQYHSENRPLFILFTEFIAFTGTIAVMVGMAVLFSLLR
jgi:hypothetical protein